MQNDQIIKVSLIFHDELCYSLAETFANLGRLVAPLKHSAEACYLQTQLSISEDSMNQTVRRQPVDALEYCSIL